MLKQRIGGTLGCCSKLLCEAGRKIPTDAAARQALEKYDTPEVTSDAAGANKTREEFFQDGEIHIILLVRGGLKAIAGASCPIPQ